MLERWLLVTQTLFYAVALVILLILTGLFYAMMEDVNRRHDRLDLQTRQMLKEHDALLQQHDANTAALQASTQALAALLRERPIR